MCSDAGGPPFDLADWFHRRTWSVDDVDLDGLAALKNTEGVSVSVVLPARDEAETITGVVTACAELGGKLVDEIVVLDGGSSDDTARLAAEAGARVHTDEAILPDFPSPAGKGDALWRSLAVTSGDIVCFLDSDVRNPDPRFVIGLLVPLLHEPEIQLVKAFYERPLDEDGQRRPSGGGRVTELCARPLLNLLWPELAGLVQPLSGEYAGRRSMLEAVPFFTGYGVELGLLIDTLRHAGPDAIAQVDVHERIHGHQPLDALGRMAFAIMKVAAQRLADEGRSGALAEPPDTLAQFSRTEEATALAIHEVVIEERPPMRTLR